MIWLLILCLILMLFLAFYYIFRKLGRKKHHLSQYSDEDRKRLHEYFDINLENKIQFPIYYINLDRSLDRRIFMENQFRKCNISNYTRVPAVDGKELTRADPWCLYRGLKILNEYPQLNNGEIGCVMSHLLAIQTAFDAGDEISVIMEDDCLFTTMAFWKKPLPDIIKNAPADWEILQLFRHSHQDGFGNFDYFFYQEVYTPSTSCYVINREGMRKILNFARIPYYAIRKIAFPIENLRSKAGVADIYLYFLTKRYVVQPFLTILHNPTGINTIEDARDTNDLDAQRYFLSKNQRIVVVLVGGLGNQLRCLSSAMVLARFLNIPLFLAGDNTLCELFDDMFPFLSAKYTHKKHWVSTPFQENCSKQFNQRCSTSIVVDVKNQVLKEVEIIVSSWMLFKHPLQSLGDFHKARLNALRSLRPKKHISSLIPKIDPSVVGIHIRTTDSCLHLWKDQNQCLILLDKFRNIINKTGGIYLATDNDSFKEEMRARPNVLTNNSVKTNRNTDGFKWALVELLTLASCKYIIGTVGSTFSSEAIFLCGSERSYQISPADFETTVVTCYYESSKSKEEYRKWITDFMKIESPVVLFTDSTNKPWLIELRKGLPIFVVEKQLSSYIIPEWNKQHLIDPEKGKQYTIWNSKVNFVEESIQINPFQTRYFLWCDIGAFRQGPVNGFITNNFFPPNKVYLQSVQRLKNTDKLFRGNIPPSGWKEDRIVGEFWGGEKEACLKWIYAYKLTLNKYLKKSYFAGKEQNVMLSTYLDHPELAEVALPTCKGDQWFCSIQLGAGNCKYVRDESYTMR